MIVAGIPAYNEEKTIAKVILLVQKHVDKVVVCDDGSEDLTQDIARRLGAVVVRHEKNMGYGAAIQALFRKAKELDADLLLTIDADGQHDAEEIPRLLQPILENKADIVIGSRFLKPKNGMPAYRRFGVKVLTKMTNGSKGGGSLTDGQCGLRAYNKQAIECLDFNESGMGISAEIIMTARNHDLRIAEVPVNVHYHNLETSTHNPLRHGLGVLSTIIRLVVEERPLFYLGLPGVVFLMVGASFGLWTAQLYAIEHRIVTNVFLVAIVFVVLGVFTTFTAITLYAVLRVTQKLKTNRTDNA